MSVGKWPDQIAEPALRHTTRPPTPGLWIQYAFHAFKSVVFALAVVTHSHDATHSSRLVSKLARYGVTSIGSACDRAANKEVFPHRRPLKKRSSSSCLSHSIRYHLLVVAQPTPTASASDPSGGVSGARCNGAAYQSPPRSYCRRRRPHLRPAARLI